MLMQLVEHRLEDKIKRDSVYILIKFILYNYNGEVE
jgi:hypothetical protein